VLLPAAIINLVHLHEFQTIETTPSNSYMCHVQ
jgi:hypothetical protein